MIPVTLTLNGLTIQDFVRADEMLIDFVRRHGAKSTKRGCDTSNCGACSVLVDDELVLACSTPTYRCANREITTLEGLNYITKYLRPYLANQGADQCGFCNPGFLVAAVALIKQLSKTEQPQLPGEQAIAEYLMGNLCRCTGYVSQARGLYAFLSENIDQLHQLLAERG